MPALAFSLAVLGMGFSSLLLQVVLVRELLASFFGNELSIGLVFANWLLLVAFGSHAGGRLAARRHPSVWPLVAAQVLLALVMPLAFAEARGVGGATAFPGQVIGPVQTAYLSMLVLGLPCVIVGAQFALACRFMEREDQAGDGVPLPSVSRVYILEGAGACVAGLVFHFGLAEHVSPVAQIGWLMLLNGVLAFVLVAAEAAPTAGRRALQTGAALVALLLGVVVVFPLVKPFDRSTLWRRWRGFHLLASVDSRYGNLAVTRREGQLSFFHDGLLMFTTEDWQQAEELAHLPLLMHPRPRCVLFLGGGLGGALVEVLKHPVESVDYVELDGRVVDLARKYLPPELQTPFRDPRVHFHTADAWQFVRESRQQYDVIIVNLPDPSTANLSRFYTTAFLARLARLAPGGVVSTGLSSSESYLTGPRRLMHVSVFSALSPTWPPEGITVVPGGRVTFLCHPADRLFSTDPRTLARRLAERHLHARLVNEFYLANLLMPFKREQYLASLVDGPLAPANSTDNPISYRYYLQTWLAEQAPGVAPVLGAWRALLVALGMLLVFGVRAVLKSRRPLARAVVAAIGVMGFVGIGLELLIIFAFQVAAGYVFHQIGLLLALFMAGLTAGAYLAQRWATSSPPVRWAPLFGCLGALAALALFALLRLSAGVDPRLAAGVASALAGAVGGCAFTLALAMASAYDRAPGSRVAASLYAADLLGSALGAVIVSVVLLPTVGLGGTMLTLALLSLGVVGLLGVATAVGEHSR